MSFFIVRFWVSLKKSDTAWCQTFFMQNFFDDLQMLQSRSLLISGLRLTIGYTDLKWIYTKSSKVVLANFFLIILSTILLPILWCSLFIVFVAVAKARTSY